MLMILHQKREIKEQTSTCKKQLRVRERGTYKKKCIEEMERGGRGGGV